MMANEFIATFFQKTVSKEPQEKTAVFSQTVSPVQFVHALFMLKEKRADTPTAKKKKRPIESEDLLDPGVGGSIADYLFGGSRWGGTRAGKATQMARAVGETPSMNVTNPLTSDFLGRLGGVLGGAGIGMGLETMMPRGGSNAGTRMGVGAVAGGLSLPLLLRYLRRQSYEDIGQKFDAASQAGTLKNPRPEIGKLQSVLLPFGGSHRAGQADAYEAIRDQERPKDSPGRHVGYAASTLPLGGLLGLPQGIQQGVNASNRVAR